MKHEQNTKREKSKLQERLAKKKSQQLSPDPETPTGKAIILELLGGNGLAAEGVTFDWATLKKNRDASVTRTSASYLKNWYGPE